MHELNLLGPNHFRKINNKHIVETTRKIVRQQLNACRIDMRSDNIGREMDQPLSLVGLLEITLPAYLYAAQRGGNLKAG